MKQILCVKTYDDVLVLANKAIEDAVMRTETFAKAFNREHIQLVIKPCYFYNQRFHTKCRKKGASVFLRIQLFDDESTFEQATKKHMSKAFFSRKLIAFAENRNGYEVVLYPCQDAAMECFFSRLLNKVEFLKKRGKPAKNVLRENLGDVLRSVVFMNRYRTEVKTNFYSFDLQWIILFLVIILILLRVHAHYELIFNAS